MRTNRFVIVGHPQSGLEEVLELLFQSGVKGARPSRGHNYSPAQISGILLEAHGVDPAFQIASDEPLEQLEISPVWNGLSSDLVLANIDQDIWGWADPKVVYLLDYWLKIDSRISFVLTYNEPKSVYTRMTFEHPSVSESELEARLKGWIAFNSAILSFHLRHPKRTILIHSDQAKISVQRCIALVQGLLGNAQTISTLGGFSEKRTPGRQEANSSTRDAVEPRVCREVLCNSRKLLDDTTLSEFLAIEMVRSCSRSAQLYEELQATASLPSEKSLDRCPHSDTAEPAAHHRAWKALLAQRIALRDCAFQLRAQGSELNLLRVESERKDSVIEELRNEQSALGRLLNDAQAERTEIERKNAESSKAESQGLEREKNDLLEDNKLLLAQLHQAQEELERHLLEAQSKKDKTSPPLYGAANRIKQQLSYRLGAMMIEHPTNLRGKFTLPVVLIREVRRYRKEFPAMELAKLPPIEAYADAQDADRMKRHLSYRLGVTLLAHSKNPIRWASLPWALRHEVMSFEEERRAKSVSIAQK